MASGSRRGHPDLGFVLSRCKLARLEPVVRRPLSSLDPVFWLANQQHHHRMLMAILLNSPPLSPSKQICAVLSITQSHWLADTRELASCESSRRVAASVPSRGVRLRTHAALFLIPLRIHRQP